MRLLYLHEPIIGLSQARNAGLSIVNSPWVAFLDDDAVPDPYWLESAIGVFETVMPLPAWIGGPVVPDYAILKPHWLDAIMEGYLSVLDFGEVPRWLEPHEHLCGGNSAYNTRVFQEVGRFDTRLGRKHACLISGEETEMEKRLDGAGGRRYYHPGMRILHHVAEERLRPEWLYRRAFWGGVSDRVIARIAHEPTVPMPAPAERLIVRAVRHIGWSIFSTSLNLRIRGRIYIAYALGWLSGRLYLHKLE
jgi:GT2 family glycosyltransferase